MKKIIYTLFIINLSLIIAQAQWVQVSTISNAQLNCVKFFDQNTGVTAGTGGIWRSTNGGLNWNQTLSSLNINALSFSDVNSGLAVGDSGRIFRSSNGGINWEMQNSGTANVLYGVSFPSLSIGYAVGGNGIIIKTYNGGVSWATQITTGYDFYNIKMRDITTGIAVGSPSREYMMSTANGGYNWILVYTNQGPSLRSVEIIGISIVIAVGDNGRIRKSTNGGATWSFPASNTTQQLNAIVFPDQNTGYITGNGGTILKSINVGLGWFAQATNVQNNLRGLSFINVETGWAVGQNGIVMNIGLQLGIKNIQSEFPHKFSLSQNYPNPFNPTTKIRFDVPSVRAYRDTPLHLVIYDILGREISTLVNGQLKPGTYEVEWDGSNYPSGVYFYRLETENFTQTKKLILLK